MRSSAPFVGLALLFAAAGMATQGAEVVPADNAELARLYQEDQDDRKPAITDMDWSVVKPRDDARLRRVKELYAAGSLQTGSDWLRAAVILQHGDEPDDFLLAHEMCIAAILKGEHKARSMAAASEDRFLRRIGRPQRFGTQWEPADKPGTFKLAPTDPGVSDQLRSALGVPTLAESRARESQFDKKR
jgi:hypothetical protein